VDDLKEYSDDKFYNMMESKNITPNKMEAEVIKSIYFPQEIHVEPVVESVSKKNKKGKKGKKN